MGDWPVHCFKAYDIRGLAGDDLSDEFAYRLGRSLAKYLKCSSFAVGRDIRESSPGYASNLIQGLVESGVKVLDLGIVSTGCLYHACSECSWYHSCSALPKPLPLPLPLCFPFHFFCPLPFCSSSCEPFPALGPCQFHGPCPLPEPLLPFFFGPFLLS